MSGIVGLSNPGIQASVEESYWQETSFSQLPTDIVKFEIRRRLDETSRAALALTCKSIKVLLPLTEISEQELISAAAKGDFSTLKRAKRLGYEIPQQAIIKAAENGHVDILDWACGPSLFSKIKFVIKVILSVIFGLTLGGLALACLLKWDDLKYKLPFGMDNAAAAAGQLEVLRWLKDKVPFSYWHRSNRCDAAAAAGQMEALKLLQEQGYRLEATTFAAAAKSGNLEVLKWLKEQNCPWYAETFAVAAKSGNLEVLKWLKEQNCPWDEKACTAAAGSGELDALKWLIDENFTWNRDECAAAAIAEGRINILEYLKSEKNYVFTESEFITAAEKGNVKAFEWLHNFAPTTPRYNKEICNKAVEGGHVEVLESALKKSYECTTDICNLAASKGKLEVLKLLRQYKFAWNTETFAAATESGNLELLEWLKKEGCPWDATTCEAAAKHNQLQVLSWLRNHDCPWDERTLYAALKIPYGHYLIIWVIQNGCPFIPSKALEKFPDSDHDWIKDFSPYFYKQNASYCNTAAANGSLEILQYLLESGFKRDVSACREAAKHGQLEALKLLRKHNCPWDSSICWTALENKQFDIIVWAFENGCPCTLLEWSNIFKYSPNHIQDKLFGN